MKKPAGLTSLLVFGLVISLGLNLFLAQKLFPQSTVLRIIDGDTFELKTGTKIRLADLDAPEIKDCLGVNAKDKLQSLILNKTVKLEKETVDNFGRVVAFVFINQQSVNEALIKDGLAKTTASKNSIYHKKMLDLELEAKEKGLGLWGDSCPQPTPQPPDCLIKGNIHWKKKQKLYSRPGCYNYNKIVIDQKNGDRWFCSEEEAKSAGFSLSLDCPVER